MSPTQSLEYWIQIFNFCGFPCWCLPDDRPLFCFLLSLAQTPKQGQMSLLSQLEQNKEWDRRLLMFRCQTRMIRLTGGVISLWYFVPLDGLCLSLLSAAEVSFSTDTEMLSHHWLTNAKPSPWHLSDAKLITAELSCLFSPLYFPYFPLYFLLWLRNQTESRTKLF